MTADQAPMGETGSIVDLGMPAPGGAFDEHHPPDAALIGDCVHCGFCLPTCPTYVLWGEEMDSPRGRIYLMKEGLEGEPMSDSMVSHWDACLGCMACVTACPSGVQYDTLIEQTRAQVERNHERSAKDKALRGLIFSLFPHPKRLRLLRGPLRAMQATGLDRAPAAHRAAGPDGARSSRRWRASRPAWASPSRCRRTSTRSGPRRAVVGLLTGCVQGAFFPGVNSATARVLQAEGCDVVVPASQGCCGALSVHNGREEEAQGFARKLVDSFEATGVEHVVVNAAGCGSTMKEYAALLADDPAYAERAKAFAGKVRDVSEILDELGPVAPRHPLEHDHRLPRRLPPRARPRGARPAAAAARGDPRPVAEGDRRAGAVLRLGRHLQHRSTPSRPASSATARRPTSSRPGPRCSSPPTPAASCRSPPRSSAPATRWGWRTRSRCSTPRSGVLRSSTFARH